MSDTHINAFFGAVDEALAKVQVAQGELQAAQDRLAVKKKEVGYVESEEVKSEETAPAKVAETKAVDEDKSSLFSKKKVN